MSTAASAFELYLPSNLKVVVSDWKPVGRNTLVGTFNVRFENGLVIQGCLLHVSASGPRIEFPGAPQLDHGQLRRGDDGNIRYKTVVKFTAPECHADFSRTVLEELKKLVG